MHFLMSMATIAWGVLPVWSSTAAVGPSDPLEADGRLPVGESKEEKLLRSFALTYEDVVAALRSVECRTDADLVASRVAVDFILLYRLQEQVLLLDMTQISTVSAADFLRRYEQARDVALEVSANLRLKHCYESKALASSLQLALLLTGELEDERALEHARELAINNLEVSLLLVRQVEDDATAQSVAPLLRSTLHSRRVINDFIREYGQADPLLPLDQESKERLVRYVNDFSAAVEALEAEDFYHDSELRAVLGETLANP